MTNFSRIKTANLPGEILNGMWPGSCFPRSYRMGEVWCGDLVGLKMAISDGP